MNITKEQALAKIEELKSYVDECDKQEVTKKKLQILNRFTGAVVYESEKTTYKEVVEEAYLSGANLREAYLSGADLSEADLSGADLSEADLSGADLSEADLREANLREAYLSGANLREADLSGAELMDAKFYGKGGTSELTKEQVPDFLKALGFIITD